MIKFCCQISKYTWYSGEQLWRHPECRRIEPPSVFITPLVSWCGSRQNDCRVKVTPTVCRTYVQGGPFNTPLVCVSFRTSYLIPQHSHYRGGHGWKVHFRIIFKLSPTEATQFTDRKWHPFTGIQNHLKEDFKSEKNTQTCVKVLKRVMFYYKICIVKYVWLLLF